MLGANPNTAESYSGVGWPIAPDRWQPTAAPNSTTCEEYPQSSHLSSEPPDIVGWRDDISRDRNRRWQSDSKCLVFKEPLQRVSCTRQLLPFPLVYVLWLPQWAGLLSRNQGRNNDRTYCLALVLKKKKLLDHLIILCFLGCKFSGNR